MDCQCLDWRNSHRCLLVHGRLWTENEENPFHSFNNNGDKTSHVVQPSVYDNFDDDHDDDDDHDHDHENNEHGTKMMTLPPVNLWIELAEPCPPPGVEQTSTSLRPITKTL